MSRHSELVAALSLPWPEETCLEWHGAVNSHGYGVVGFNIRPGLDGRMSAHRFALEVKLARPLRDGLMALHTCDNRRCFNPNHLYEGTHLQNTDDMRKRDRWNSPKGSAHWAARLNETAVKEIRARAAAGETQASIGKAFDIRQQDVSRIVKRLRWGHV